MLVAAFGVSLGWLGVQVKWIRDRASARSWIAEHGFFVTKSGSSEPPASAPWPIRPIEPGVTSIYVTVNTDEERHKVPELKRLFPESQLNRVERLENSAAREWQVLGPL